MLAAAPTHQDIIDASRERLRQSYLLLRAQSQQGIYPRDHGGFSALDCSGLRPVIKAEHHEAQAARCRWIATELGQDPIASSLLVLATQFDAELSSELTATG